ncbi:MAG TPA: hypothetical protein VIM33_15625 [Gaiellaceae bacterium]|jgi:hypothetical protein
MATGNTPKGRRPGAKAVISIEEHLAPLAAAMPALPTGRVRSLEEARGALRIPTSAEAEILQLWGAPKDFQLVVYPVAEPMRPDRVAEFALLRVVKRNGRELVVGDRHTRLRLEEVGEALWVVYGSIAVANDGSLVLESLGIGPAFDGQLSRKGDVAHGITSPFLRLLSPPRILAACAEQLLIHRYRLDQIALAGTKPMSAKQRDLLDRIDEGRPQHAHISDDRLADFAERYLELYYRGEPNLRLRLAAEFGLTTTQVRDRTNQARRRGYLTAGSRGRAGAEPGSRLLERGWRPPEPETSTVVKNGN